MMRIALILALCLFALPVLARDVQVSPVAAVYFSPAGGATQALVAEIDRAEISIYVLAYSFTSEPIAAALVRAQGRGVSVNVVLDRSQETAKGTQAGPVHEAGIPVVFDERHAIAHNKVMIFDQRRVATGSFNFTRAAEQSNAENLIILEGEELARVYLENWQVHEGHSVAW